MTHPARIGRFDVVEQLGRGGFGVVYKALDPATKRTVAIKVLDGASNEVMLRRFLAESETTATLNHPHIVTLFEVGSHGETPYFVMEYLAGKDVGKVLREEVEGRALTLAAKVRILLEVAEALAYAHERGVVHRDIKPGNVMLLPDGHVKVMDFGIARQTSSDTTRKTQKGFLVGTVAYMAPEQFQEQDADRLTDIFAYGVLAYELIAGRHPFDADDAMKVAFRILSPTDEPPALAVLLPEVPDSLSRVVQLAMAKERELRYRDLEEVRLDLQPVLDELNERAAAALVEQARAALAAGDAEHSLGLLREALRLDPGHRAARALRDEHQRAGQQQAARKRAAALLAEARGLLAARQWDEALQRLENAAKLDTLGGTVEAELARAREIQERVKRSRGLYLEAQREAGRKNWTAAEERLAAALRLDAQQTEAGALLAKVQAALAGQGRAPDEGAAREPGQQRQHIDEAIRAARQALQQERYVEARDRLRVLEESAGADESVRAMLAEIDADERRGQVERLVGDAGQAERGGRLADALGLFEQVLFVAPDNTQAREGRARAGAALARQKEIAAATAELERTLSQAIARRSWSEAEQQLAHAPAEVRQQTAIQDWSKRLAEEKDRADRTAVFAAVEQALRDGRLEAGLAEAAAGLQRWRGWTELERLQRTLQERQRTEQDVAALLAAAAADLTAGRTEKALQALEAGQRRHGQRPDLAETIVAARARWALERADQAVAAALAQAAQAESKGRWSEAVQTIESALQQHPGRVELREALVRLHQRQEAERAQQRARQITQQKDLQEAGVRAALERRDAVLAAKLLQAAEGEYPHDRRWAELRLLLMRLEVVLAAEAQRRPGVTGPAALVTRGTLLSRRGLVGALVGGGVAVLGGFSVLLSRRGGLAGGLRVTPGVLALRLPANGRGEVPFTVGGGPFTTAEDVAWLKVNPTVGQGPGRVSAQFDATGVKPGRYTGRLMVNPVRGAAVEVPVELVVVAGPRVTLTPSVRSVGVEGWLQGPPLEPRRIQLTATAPVQWTAQVTGGAQWLAVTPLDGSTPGTVTVSFRVGGLNEGSYSGEITIMPEAADVTPVKIPVRLTLRPPG